MTLLYTRHQPIRDNIFILKKIAWNTYGFFIHLDSSGTLYTGYVKKGISLDVLSRHKTGRRAFLYGKEKLCFSFTYLH